MNKDNTHKIDTAIRDLDTLLAGFDSHKQRILHTMDELRTLLPKCDKCGRHVASPCVSDGVDTSPTEGHWDSFCE